MIVAMVLAMTSSQRGVPSPCGSAGETNLDQDAVPRRTKTRGALHQRRYCVGQLRGLRVDIDRSTVETGLEELGTGRRDRDGYSNDDPAATETLRRVETKRKE
jgi:hypothetical protein